MKMNEIDTEQLKKFVDGQLDATETEKVLNLLANSDEALEHVDRLWDAQYTQLSAKNITPQTAKKIEGRLMRQINRSNLGAAVAKMGIQGFAEVLLALVRPFIPKSHSTKEKEKEMDNIDD